MKESAYVYSNKSASCLYVINQSTLVLARVHIIHTSIRSYSTILSLLKVLVFFPPMPLGSLIYRLLASRLGLPLPTSFIFVRKLDLMSYYHSSFFFKRKLDFNQFKMSTSSYR